MDNESLIKTKIVEIIRQNLNLSEEQEIGESTPLADIISNSVEFIQIIIDIEDEFNIEFKNNELDFNFFPCIEDLVMKARSKIYEASKRGNDGSDFI